LPASRTPTRWASPLPSTPTPFSSLSGAPQSQLNIGKSIFYNERINTTGSGLVQVLLVDGSTFTVGPGSDLVIDKFVYDPNKKTGQVVASLSKGVMRFVGGKISKNDEGVTIKTPAGALAIRGGMGMAQVNGPKSAIFAFLYGVEMKLNPAERRGESGVRAGQRHLHQQWNHGDQEVLRDRHQCADGRAQQEQRQLRSCPRDHPAAQQRRDEGSRHQQRRSDR
jgi:hypothetical protein